MVRWVSKPLGNSSARECLSMLRRIHAGDDALRANRPFREHCGFALALPLLVQIFQRTQQIVGGILLKQPPVFAVIQQTVFCGKSVVDGVQTLLCCLDVLVREVVQLLVNQVVDDTPANRSTEAWVCRRPCTEMIGIKGSCFFNTAAHRDVIQASCYPMASKINCTTIVFEEFCITTRTRQGRSKPFLEKEGFRFFVFGGVPAAQQKHPQRMTGLLQLRRSALRMLIFYAVPLP